MTDRCDKHSKIIHDNEIMLVRQDEKLLTMEKDITALGNIMRSTMKDFKAEIKTDFESVWKAIDGMLIKVGILVTLCTSIVMAVFKIIEIVK